MSEKTLLPLFRFSQFAVAQKAAYKNKMWRIAIDGPASSGKSTTAKLVAQQLNFLYVNTGAFYRAVTLKCINQFSTNHLVHLDTPRIAEITAMIKATSFSMSSGNLLMDNLNVQKQLQDPEMVKSIKYIADVPEIRNEITLKIRKLSTDGHKGIVADGRDICSVIFPDATLKIFLVADVRSRALRRFKELRNIENPPSFEKVKEDIENRDFCDINRNHGPLIKTSDAIELDTSNLTIEKQVCIIVDLFKSKIRGD
jgi:cytidylate kinase